MMELKQLMTIIDLKPDKIKEHFDVLGFRSTPIEEGYIFSSDCSSNIWLVNSHYCSITFRSAETLTSNIDYAIKRGFILEIANEEHQVFVYQNYQAFFTSFSSEGINTYTIRLRIVPLNYTKLPNFEVSMK